MCVYLHMYLHMHMQRTGRPACRPGPADRRRGAAHDGGPAGAARAGRVCPAGGWPGALHDGLQVTSYQLQATSHKLHATSYKLQAISHKLKVTSYKLQVASCKLHDGARRAGEGARDGGTRALGSARVLPVLVLSDL